MATSLITEVNGKAAEETPPLAARTNAARVVMSFDIEEHYRIEAASHLAVSGHDKLYYRQRMETVTRWLLEQLADRGIRATFYVVGELADLSKGMVRAIADAGHEVASHGWDHRRVLGMTREEFRRDARQSKDALEQVTGAAVTGYRAPTFSIVRQTSWALEVLAEEGYLYDSSIYPVRHDRYGIPEAPAVPFVVRTPAGPILEIPPLTLRCLWRNWPVGGGGYFRLLPNWLMYRGIARKGRQAGNPPAMLYFHPWEFDPGQRELPLGWLSRMRTYSGIRGGRERLCRLLESGYEFETAAGAARRLTAGGNPIPEFVVPGVPSDSGDA